MSVEANTYEELTIQNVNEKTALLCSAVSEYLLKIWGINYISLTIDSNTYESTEEESIEEGSELYHACQSLTSAKKISLRMRSCNGGGAYWRQESSFMKMLTDDAEIKANATYRSTDYYDTDPGVDMYLFNENGLQRVGYTAAAENVSDIKEWYCYTPALRIADEEQSENAGLHERIMSIVTKLCGLFGLVEEEIEDRLDDDWEDYGEIILNGSIRFINESIPEVVSLGNRLVELLKDSESAELEFEIYTVPDGEDDYDFASAAITFDGKAIVDSYCKF